MTSIEKLKGLRPYLLSHIRGQTEAIDRICTVVRISELKLSLADEPRGTFLYLGPTGTGKTETNLALANYLFGADHLFRFDMSEFANAETLPNFIGDHTGQLGRLGDVLSRATEGVLLFDEFEKAHPNIRDQFLQIIEKGRITVGNGRHFRMNGFYIACTSNIGARSMMEARHLNATSTEKNVMAVLRQELRPEQIGRFNSILIFNQLTPPIQHEICEQILNSELERLARDCGHRLSYQPEVIPFLLRTGYDRELGARPMKANTQRQVRNALALSLMEDGTGCGVLAVDNTGQSLQLISEPKTTQNQEKPDDHKLEVI